MLLLQRNRLPDRTITMTWLDSAIHFSSPLAHFFLSIRCQAFFISFSIPVFEDNPFSHDEKKGLPKKQHTNLSIALSDSRNFKGKETPIKNNKKSEISTVSKSNESPNIS